MFHVIHKSSCMSLHLFCIYLLFILFTSLLLQNSTWYRDVIELRKKAGEYKVGIPRVKKKMTRTHQEAQLI